MKIEFQALDTSYRVPVSTRRRQAPTSQKTRADYDTVTIQGPRMGQGEDESFARILAKSAASQLGEGAGPERVQELGRQVASGVYKPDAQRIAGRLLGLN